LFDPENDRRARARREEVSRIRQALNDGEFVLYYQPNVNMREGCVTGAEALIRWQHPEQGLLLPGEFLPAIEGSELAVELGDWVICEAFRQLERLAVLGLDISISINIASNHLLNAGFAERLSELLRLHPTVLPRRVELEILETAALEDMTLVAELFAECRKLGVTFALDDFGTGYSSLTYLRRLPADVLKIDQSFVRDMLDDPDDLAIVESVISLTQAFQRKVVAEGVETVEHGLVLLLLNCDTAQGFGIARPMPGHLLPGWINSFFPDTLWSLATSFRWSREDMPMLIAEVDHGRWKKKLLAYLDDTTDTILMPAGDHHDCRFGRWYYSPESKRYAAVDGFLALEKVHTQIHEIGAELVRLRHSPDRTTVAQLRRDLEAASMVLIECIQQLQAEILIAG
jgi:EAL domain-containing protein (putative c-di-GMP-specific phosphodiesterase class I)